MEDDIVALVNELKKLKSEERRLYEKIREIARKKLLDVDLDF